MDNVKSLQTPPMSKNTIRKSSYEIVADEIRKFWRKTYPQTVIAFFDQKYDHESEWERHNELASPIGDNDYKNVEYEYDFCEGQTDVRNVHIASLEEVTEFYRKHNIKECDSNEQNN
jgi:hypothetical protein